MRHRWHCHSQESMLVLTHEHGLWVVTLPAQTFADLNSCGAQGETDRKHHSVCRRNHWISEGAQAHSCHARWCCTHLMMVLCCFTSRFWNITSICSRTSVSQPGKCKAKPPLCCYSDLARCCVYTHAGHPAVRGEIGSAHLRHSGLNDLGHRRDRLLCYCWVCRCHDEQSGDAYNCTQAQP